jgi:predicted dehydrogenase
MGKASGSKRKGKFRMAMIGVGGIGASHMKILAGMPDVELVGMADPSEKALAARAVDFPDCKPFADYQTMLAEVEADGVDVCAPNGVHAPAAIAALDAGAHVIVEKPMAMNAGEAQAMIDAAKKNKRKLCIAFQYRYTPAAVFLRKAMEAGQFGDVIYARVQALRRRGIPSWGVFGRKDLQGGGPLIDIGVHALEVAHYVMGSPRPVTASGATFTYLGDKKCEVACPWSAWDHTTYTVEDLAIGHIRFENGAVLNIESSFAAHIKENVFNFQVMGTRGGGTYSPPMIFRDQDGHMVNIEPDFLPTVDHFHAKLRDFIDHAMTGSPTLIAGEQGLMVQKMLDGIYQSAEAGREVGIE